MNIHIARMASMVAATAALSGGAWLGTTVAHAAPGFTGPTINLSDAPWIDALPVCVQEDCSDQPGQVGVWTSPNDGAAYIELGEGVTVAVVDDTTVTGGALDN